MGVFGDVHEDCLNIFITEGRGEPASREGGGILPNFKKAFLDFDFEEKKIMVILSQGFHHRGQRGSGL